MHTETVEYTDGDITCKGYVAYSQPDDEKRPCVIISHAWGGQDDFVREKANKLAELGFTAFALDNYGQGRCGASMDENGKLMQPFMDDRAMLRKRLSAGYMAAQAHPAVDSERMAIIGYCFGGLCALDLARAVPNGLQGAVSFHGLFYPANLGAQADIAAKILILHGFDDPMAPPAEALGIAKELTDAKADWQLHAYGHTGHAFTNPAMNMPENGLVFNATADKRSWQSMKDFLAEALAWSYSS